MCRFYSLGHHVGATHHPVARCERHLNSLIWNKSLKVVERNEFVETAVDVVHFDATVAQLLAELRSSRCRVSLEEADSAEVNLP